VPSSLLLRDASIRKGGRKAGAIECLCAVAGLAGRRGTDDTRSRSRWPHELGNGTSLLCVVNPVPYLREATVRISISECRLSHGGPLGRRQHIGIDSPCFASSFAGCSASRKSRLLGTILDFLHQLSIGRIVG